MVRQSLALTLIIAVTACQRLPDGDGGGADGVPMGEDSTTDPWTMSPPGTSAMATGGSTTGLDSSDGGGFISDGEPPCVVSDETPWHCLPVLCDIYTQQGCGEGEKCTGWGSGWGPEGGPWNTTRCVPVVENPAAPGEACTMEGSSSSGIDDCDADSMCWFSDGETLEGVCTPFCSGNETEPECPMGTSCLDSNDGGIVLCLPDCDPLQDDCEIPNSQCVWHDGFRCSVAGTDHGAGEPCSNFNACAPGLLCADSIAIAPSCDQGAVGCCTPFCDLLAPDPTAGCFDPAQVCMPFWWEEPPPGQENLGLCSVPE